MFNKKNIIIISLSVVVSLILGVLAGYFFSANLVEKKEETLPQITQENGEIKEIREPALIYFYGKDCSSCHKFKPNWNIIKRKYGKKFTILEIDVDKYENYPLCYEFMVNVIPTVYIEDAPFRNRALINPAEYQILPRFQDTLDRYLEMRKILIKGVSVQ